jgi:hypothetical protein
MHPTAKLISQIYCATDRVHQMSDSDPSEVLSEIKKLETLMFKSRILAASEMLEGTDNNTAEFDHKNEEACGIIEKLSHVRDKGFSLVSSIKMQLEDISECPLLDESFDSLKILSEEIRVLAKSTHELTKEISFEVDNNLHP